MLCLIDDSYIARCPGGRCAFSGIEPELMLKRAPDVPAGDGEHLAGGMARRGRESGILRAILLRREQNHGQCNRTMRRLVGPSVREISASSGRPRGTFSDLELVNVRRGGQSP